MRSVPTGQSSASWAERNIRFWAIGTSGRKSRSSAAAEAQIGQRRLKRNSFVAERSARRRGDLQSRERPGTSQRGYLSGRNRLLGIAAPGGFEMDRAAFA
jgi:hypothetical protein